MEKEKKTLNCELLSRIWLSATPWTAAHQAPLSIRFPRHKYWSGLPFPSLGDLPDPEIKPGSPALQADSVLSEPPGLHKMGMDYIWVPWAMVCQIWVWSILQHGIKNKQASFKGSIHIHGAIYVNFLKNQNLTIILYGYRCAGKYETWTGKTYTNFPDGSECNLLD